MNLPSLNKLQIAVLWLGLAALVYVVFVSPPKKFVKDESGHSLGGTMPVTDFSTIAMYAFVIVAATGIALVSIPNKVASPANDEWQADVEQAATPTNSNTTTIILGSLLVLVTVICFVLRFYMNEEIARLKDENRNLEFERINRQIHSGHK